MFRDRSEELERLQAELLAEEEEPEELLEEEEEEEEEEELPWRFEDTRPASGGVIYQNYSNDYGKELRNYASGYRAYNSDKTDEPLESYSEEVRRGSDGGSVTALAVIACLLALAVAAAVIILVATKRGLL